jgi:hypothetical protein
MRNALLIFLAGAVVVMGANAPEEASAIRALNEWTSVCHSDGVLLWSKSLCGPLVLVSPQTHSAIADRPDPDGKFHRQESVYIGALPKQFTPSNTSIRWNQQDWAMVMLPLPTDPFLRLALLAHESFHSVQPSLGLRASDAPDPSLDTEAGRLWMRLELRR